MSVPTFNNSIGDTLIQHAVEREEVPLKSLYDSKPAVILLLRRWGCLMCRGYAQKMQRELGPLLAANNIRLCAIGMEQTGVEEFVSNQYFNNDELFVDRDRRLYQALRIKRFNIVSGVLGLCNTSTCEWYGEVRKMGISGNLLEGDGLQLGATFIVGSDGAVWLDYRQKDFGDHPTRQTIIETLQQYIPTFNKSL